MPGSGLPELISFCSCGYTMDPDFFSLKTIICKSLSIIFVLAAGVCVGREGPAIVIGAATAHLLGKVMNRVIHKLVQYNPKFNETLGHLCVGDFSRPFSGPLLYEIVHIGAACGFACAFYAPIGGALFIYEELVLTGSCTMKWLQDPIGSWLVRSSSFMFRKNVFWVQGRSNLRVYRYLRWGPLRPRSSVAF